MANAKGVRAGRAFVELFADDSKLVRGLRSAQAKLKAFGTAVAGLGRKLAAVGAAVAAPLIASVKSFASAGSALLEMSRRTGISVERLAELKFAAEQTGVSIEDMETGIRRMQKAIVEAAKGSADAQRNLALLGLSLADLDGLSPDEQFRLGGLGELVDESIKKIIGVTRDNVEGADITVPVYAFSKTHYLAGAVVTPAYRGTLFGLTGKVNNAAFKVEVSTTRSFALWSLASRRGSIPLCQGFAGTGMWGEAPNPDASGFGDLCHYADAEDATAKAIVKKPIAVYIEKVYEEGNFARLGIRT